MRVFAIFFNNNRPSAVGRDAKVARSRYLRNRHMSLLVTAAGWLILLMLAGLIWQLVSHSVPLLAIPKATLEHQLDLPNGQILHVGDLRQKGFLISQDANCQLRFYQLNAAQALEHFDTLPKPCGYQFSSFDNQGQTFLISVSQAGILRLERLLLSNTQLQHEQLSSFAVPDLVGQQDWQLAKSRNHFVIAFKDAEKTWQSLWFEFTDPTNFVLQPLGHAEQLLLLPRARLQILVDTNNLQIKDPYNQHTQTIELEKTLARANVLPSQRSVLLSFEDGSAQQWSLQNIGTGLAFRPTYRLDLGAEVISIQANQDVNALMLIDNKQRLFFYNSATGEVLRQQALQKNLKQTYWHNAGLYTLTDKQLSIWHLSGLAGTSSWKTFFAKNWYEGYQAPAYVWQSSPTSDVEQSKYSFVPLLIGSFKAAILALLIAIPVALGAAIYTAYFANDKLRNWLKPSIEMLEAVPSVVIGFIAAAWLSPISESILLPMVLLFVLIPASLFIVSFVQNRMLRLLPRPLRHHWEILFSASLLLLIFTAVFAYAPALNAQLNVWLDWQGNKSTLVVALALGIAIVPSIYSVVEDAIHGVPQQVKNASFALGATRLQTLQNVVLSISLPGILSGIALGFGRAFGETMILLMVTGNTPISDWNLVSGIRALSANLAIELPEAQPATELYHVLFFTALVLFAFTFCINGVAEWLRVKVRKTNQDA